jgi:ABC-type multidrug transport system fused ATPase/permease subunit
MATSTTERTLLQAALPSHYSAIDDIEDQRDDGDPSPPVRVCVKQLNVWATQSKLPSWLTCTPSDTADDPSASSSIAADDRKSIAGKTHILQNINAIVEPGELLAILGSSGINQSINHSINQQ